MNTIKLNQKTIKAIETAFIDSANFTKEHFYNKEYEERKNADSFFHGVLEAKLKDLGIDIAESWNILRDTIYHD